MEQEFSRPLAGARNGQKPPDFKGFPFGPPGGVNSGRPDRSAGHFAAPTDPRQELALVAPGTR